jgi:hypothetical protein
MADFTLSSGSICRPFRSPWGAFPVRHMPLSSGISSNAIVLGRAVALDAQTDSNASQILPSSQTAGVVVSTGIVGIAAESPGLPGSTNTRGTEIPVWEANPFVEFKAATQGAVLASSQVGKFKALVWDSTLNIHKVDLSNSTVAVVRTQVTELIDSEGDSGGYVAFKFITQTPVGSTDYCLAFYR